MQYGQNATISFRIEKLITVPSRCKRPGFSLSVANYAGYYSIRILERGPLGVR
jgi:hypothetical protein